MCNQHKGRQRLLWFGMRGVTPITSSRGWGAGVGVGVGV